MRKKHQYPEIYCDFNARVTEHGYSVQKVGSRRDLEKLGLTLEQAIGKRFTFFMDDANENGDPDDLMFNGVIVKDEKWGYLAVEDPDGIYRRSELVE